MPEHSSPRFDEALKLLAAKLRWRQTLRVAIASASWAAGVASVLAVLLLIARAAELQTGNQVSALQALAGIALITILGALIGAAVGWLKPISRERIAAWGDYVLRGGDRLQSALSATGPLAQSLRESAAVSASHATRTAVPARLDRCGFFGISLLTLALTSIGVRSLVAEAERELTPEEQNVTVMDALLGVGQQLGGLGNAIAAADAFGLTDLEGALQGANVLASVLEEGGLTEGQALAELTSLEGRLQGALGGENIEDALRDLVTGETGSDALDLLQQLGGDADVDEIMKHLSEGGAGSDQAMGLLNTLSEAAGTDAVTLEDFSQNSALLKNLLNGDMNVEQAAKMFQARDRQQEWIENTRERILSGDAVVDGRSHGSVQGHGETSAKANNEPLMIELPEKPIRPDDTNLANTTSSNRSSSVKASGRDLTATARDYESQPSRLPRELDYAILRYRKTPPSPPND